ncbi:MAG TPA: hypothetical protein VGH97_06410 [Thermoanaerobaculia bacterium]
MTPPTATGSPRCPRCHRALAAWRMGHCIYCGEAIPAELKAGFAEPDGLKFVERPPLPTDLSKKIEMMRIVNAEKAAPRKARVAWAVAAGVAFPLLIGIFYMAYSLLRQLSPISSALVIIVGMGGLGYLVVSFLKSREKGIPAGPPGPIKKT